MANGIIEVPPVVDALLDELADRYATITGEPVDSARRLIEVGALQRGIVAIGRELDAAVPVVVVPEPAAEAS